MINKTHFVFSKAAAARILGVQLNAIGKFEIWAYVCFVHVKGQRPTFISKKAFKQHFVDRRKADSKSFSVSRIKDNEFRVINPQKCSMYSVWVFQDGLDCECYDYQNQIVMLKKACCKHCYAVLNHLGFSNLSDYIEHHRWAS